MKNKLRISPFFKAESYHRKDMRTVADRLLPMAKVMNTTPSLFKRAICSLLFHVMICAA